MLTRRELLAAATTAAAFKDDALDLVAKAFEHNEGAPDDEDFWAQIQAAFTLDRNVVNFNNGGVCPSPRIVQDALRRYLEYSNQAPSYYMWRHLEPEIESVRTRLAKHFGCDREEMAITRNASEALLIAIAGIDLQRGDEVLTTDQDYPRMINGIKQRERREGVKMVQVSFPPAPKTKQELVDAIEKGITPRTKLILICHVINLTGQIWPVREIVELGRRRNIPVVVDGAHAFAQFPYSNEDLQTDYYGVSLHKWLMAPIGTGFLYVRKSKIESLWPLMADNDAQHGDIRKFEEIGTHPAANHNAIGEALTFHEMIGPERKSARLRFLRSRWADKFRDDRRFVFNTNLDPEHSCGICNVRVQGIEPADLAAWLLEKHGVFVTTINHRQFQGIRVTPNVYTTLSEIDHFADALLSAAKDGIG
jgi:selenocysteine lyase/cysteine desulfurase